MTSDWTLTCLIASALEIQTHGKELWLVRKHSEIAPMPLQDAWVPWRGEMVNLPFRPQVLIKKSDAKSAPEAFIAAYQESILLRDLREKNLLQTLDTSLDRG